MYCNQANEQTLKSLADTDDGLDCGRVWALHVVERLDRFFKLEMVGDNRLHVDGTRVEKGNCFRVHVCISKHRLGAQLANLRTRPQ